VEAGDRDTGTLERSREIYRKHDLSQFALTIGSGPAVAAGQHYVAEVDRLLSGRRDRSRSALVRSSWWAATYEEVYLHAYATVAEAKAGIGAWLSFYNDERQHQSLGYIGTCRGPWSTGSGSQRTRRWRAQSRANLSPPTPKAGGKNQNNPMRQLDEALRQLKTDREREADSGGFGVVPGVGEKAPRSERREI
jgi:hypothetical protein